MYNDRFKNLNELKKYKDFKKKVLARDGYTCRWPGCCANTNLELHHIKLWSSYPKLRYCISNCIILCHAHHLKVTGFEEMYEDMLYKLVKASGDGDNLNAGKPRYQGKYKYKKGPKRRKKKRSR